METPLRSPAPSPSTEPVVKEKVQPLKLSEAIRIGSMTTKQLYNAFGDKDVGTCGIGAAQVAFGDDPGSPALIRVLQTPIDVTTPSGRHFNNIASAIMYLNDAEHMPRQKIADWLESEGL